MDNQVIEQRLKVSNQMKAFTFLALVAILPLVIMALWWSSNNLYPFGNHDAGFHYARALSNLYLYFQYFTTDMGYYTHYPPMDMFILSSLMHLNPIMLPDYLNYDLAVFAICLGVIWIAYWFYRDINFIVLLAFSPLFIVFNSTVARLMLLILLFCFVNIKNKYQLFAVIIAMILTHSTAVWLIWGVIGFIALEALLGARLPYLLKWYDYARLMVIVSLLVIGALLAKDNLVYLPVIGGLIGWFLLEPAWKTILFLSTLVFFFFDTTASFLIILILALGLARAIAVYNAPKWFRYVALGVVLFSYSIELYTTYLQFAHTTIQQMSFNVASKLKQS